MEPYAERLLRDEGGGVVPARRDAVSSLGVAARLPRRLDDLATRLRTARSRSRRRDSTTACGLLERSVGRLVSALLFAGLLVAGALVRPTDVVLSTVLMTLSLLPLLHAVLAGSAAARRR